MQTPTPRPAPQDMQTITTETAIYTATQDGDGLFTIEHTKTQEHLGTVQQMSDNEWIAVSEFGYEDVCESLADACDFLAFAVLDEDTLADSADPL